MRKLFLALLMLVMPDIIRAADLTEPTNTPSSRQTYNAVWRDTKDGNNVPTVDAVRADLFSVLNGTTTVKSSGGLFGKLIVLTACAQPMPIADATSLPAAVVISTIPASFAAGSYTFDVRFSNGLTIGVPAACANNVTATYR